jgi:hypothetical protein
MTSRWPAPGTTDASGVATGASTVVRNDATLRRDQDSCQSWVAEHSLVVLLFVALLPIAVLTARAMFQSWVPLGDQATIALRVIEVGTSHTPLLGPYSRFGWSHPGPLLFYALALTYRVTANRVDGLLLGVLLINALALIVITRVLLRRGGITIAALGIAFFGLAMWSIGTSFLWYPWNPTVALLPFAATLVLTWAVSCGSTRAIPVLAAAASFLVQTHVEYTPLVAGFVACAVIGFWRSRQVPVDPQRERTPPPLRRALLATAAVLVVAWLPPAVDAAIHGGGNLRDLIRFGFNNHHTLGMSSAAKIMGLELSLRAPWLGFHEPLSALFQGGVAPNGSPIPAGLIVLLFATTLAGRRHDRQALRLCLIVLVSLGISTFSVANIVGTPYPYLIYFLRILAAASWLAATWTFLRALQARLPTQAERLWPFVVPGVSVAAAAIVTVVLTWSAVSAGVSPSDDHASSEALAHLMPTVLKMAEYRRGPVLVDASSSFGGIGFRSGLMFQLEQHGVAARTPKAAAFMYGSHYTDVGHVQATLLIAVDDSEIAAAHDAGAQLLAEYRQPPPYATLVQPLHLAIFRE